MELVHNKTVGRSEVDKIVIYIRKLQVQVAGLCWPICGAKFFTSFFHKYMLHDIGFV
jgi:hypothetical protein